MKTQSLYEFQIYTCMENVFDFIFIGLVFWMYDDALA